MMQYQNTSRPNGTHSFPYLSLTTGNPPPSNFGFAGLLMVGGGLPCQVRVTRTLESVLIQC